MPLDPNTQQAQQVMQGQPPSQAPQGVPQSPASGMMGGPPQLQPQGSATAQQGGDPTNAGVDSGTTPQDIASILDSAIIEVNLAKRAKDDVLQKIGTMVKEGYEADLQSCQEWMENNRTWLKMALLLRESKTYPWPGASNVKFPLLATAAMQFSARAYPTLVPADSQLVKTRVIGYDPQGTKADKADRIAKHMSFQIMHLMPNWEEDMDKLLFIEALSGVVFKKTYICPKLKTVVSDIVFPEDLIVNYWARSLDQAFRKTEHVYLTKNDVESKQRAGEFCDLGVLPQPSGSALEGTPFYQKPRANDDQLTPVDDDSTPHLFLAQHTFYDLDEDGYAEPLVILVHKETGKIARINARWASDGVEMDSKGKKVVYIEPIEYFTDFQFLPNPDGSIYGLGFGSLLGPINESVNTLINQLVDAGTLNNLQSGFISKGLRIAMKDTRMIPGEWKSVNATGDDLKSGLFPLPSKEPSAVLMNLMNMLIQSGQQLASVADIMVGKAPGQNTPASTTQESVDQSQKVFTAIYKRNYRCLLREFIKIKRWNGLSPDILEKESKMLGMQLQVSDYDNNDHDIIPAADPTGASISTQFSQLQMIGQTLLPLQVINAQEFALRNLKLIQISDPEKLIQAPPQPPPDPKIQTEQIKQQTMQQAGQQRQAEGQQKMQFEQMRHEMDGQREQMQLAFEKEREGLKKEMMMMKMQLETVMASLKIKVAKAESSQEIGHEHVMNTMDIARTHAENHLDLQHAERANAQKIELAAKQAAMKPKPTAK